MKWKKFLPELIFILISLAVGGLSSIITSKGMPYYELLNKPFFTPPAILFPIVWTILYVLMGLGAGRVWKSKDPGRSGAILLFGIQLVVNFFWSVWFFGAQRYLFSCVWLLLLLVLVVAMRRAFARIDGPAGAIQLPYVIWCVFALLLNLSIWILNR